LDSIWLAVATSSTEAACSSVAADTVFVSSAMVLLISLITEIVSTILLLEFAVCEISVAISYTRAGTNDPIKITKGTTETGTTETGTMHRAPTNHITKIFVFHASISAISQVYGYPENLYFLIHSKSQAA